MHVEGLLFAERVVTLATFAFRMLFGAYLMGAVAVGIVLTMSFQNTFVVFRKRGEVVSRGVHLALLTGVTVCIAALWPVVLLLDRTIGFSGLTYAASKSGDTYPTPSVQEAKDDAFYASLKNEMCREEEKGEIEKRTSVFLREQAQVLREEANAMLNRAEAQALVVRSYERFADEREKEEKASAR